jgi:hypothetical protein
MAFEGNQELCQIDEHIRDIQQVVLTPIMHINCNDSDDTERRSFYESSAKRLNTN